MLLAVIVGLAAGCLLGTQPSVNGSLGQNVAHPLQAALISFASGTALILVLSVATGSFPPQFTSSAIALPWWNWCGGAIGVVMVTTSLIFVPKVGSLPWFAAVMTGQTVIAIVLDHYGWLGNPKAAATPMRLLGAALLIAGVLVIVQAKRSEHRDSPAKAGAGGAAGSIENAGVQKSDIET
ncbi:MAG: DMT family transporter [Pirellulaceae bacterium]|nr:DMT family transporter [Pirellulaceae bacterium]